MQRNDRSCCARLDDKKLRKMAAAPLFHCVEYDAVHQCRLWTSRRSSANQLSAAVSHSPNNRASHPMSWKTLIEAAAPWQIEDRGHGRWRRLSRLQNFYLFFSILLLGIKGKKKRKRENYFLTITFILSHFGPLTHNHSLWTSYIILSLDRDNDTIFALAEFLKNKILQSRILQIIPK